MTRFDGYAIIIADITKRQSVDRYFLQITPNTDISKNKFFEIHIVGKQGKTPFVIEVSDLFSQNVWNKLTTQDVEEEIRRLFKVSDNEGIQY